MEDIATAASGIGLIAGIISIIAVITFFVMAYRLGNISMYLYNIGKRIHSNVFYEAQIAEMLGKNEEAVEKYIGVLYLIRQAYYKIPRKSKTQSVEFVIDKITILGGTIPDQLVKPIVEQKSSKRNRKP